MRKSNKTYLGKKMLLIFFLFFIFLVTLVLVSTRILSPLEKIHFPNSIPTSIQDIELYLSSSERFIKPKPGTEKKIFFPSEQRQKSKVSFIYLHGFSASRQETSPVVETVAKHWQAPLFMTRLHGHGLGPDQLGASKQHRWLQDAVEAYRIGLSLGDEVVITCMSTGCALGLYLAYFFPQKIKAIIMLSPNFALADRRSFLATGPLGSLITQAVAGDYQEFKPANSLQAYYWTNRYGSEVLPEMISLVTAVRNLKLESIKVPTLTLYTPFDRIVSVPDIEKHATRLGSNKNKLISLVETQEHVIAGDIMNPKMNDRVIREIVTFLREIIE